MSSTRLISINAAVNLRDLCYSVFALITSVVLCGPSVVVNASSENPRLQFSPYVISVIQN